MTDEQIKEGLSTCFFKALGTVSGFKFAVPEPDSGVDLLACKTVIRIRPDGRKRYQDSGNILRFQLKSTCQEHIIRTDTDIKYSLKNKNYNDLIIQNPSRCISPLTLILVVLPNEKVDWVNLSDTSLKISAEVFWYQADACSRESENEDSSTRITIPLSNRVGDNFITNLYGEVFS